MSPCIAYLFCWKRGCNRSSVAVFTSCGCSFHHSKENPCRAKSWNLTVVQFKSKWRPSLRIGVVQCMSTAYTWLNVRSLCYCISAHVSCINIKPFCHLSFGTNTEEQSLQQIGLYLYVAPILIPWFTFAAEGLHVKDRHSHSHARRGFSW